uniref:Reverse transcriptase N-terminal domain-containing protein n=1 Tax=Riquetophycus sp. TaxID=1897556 RepID=A0A1C9C833_9FLOR|nr:hypothetical protein Riqu_057 [Riquetophycus sp.]
MHLLLNKEVTNINSIIDWNDINWDIIKLRLYRIQQRIYKASRECDKEGIHKFQQIIMKSNDIKLLAIYKVYIYIYKYYLNYSKEKYNANNQDKTIVYNFLCENYIFDSKIENIFEQVQEYIVYLCIKPEWEAKLEPIYKSSNINNKREKKFIYRLSQFIISRFNYKSKYENIYYLKYKIYQINKLFDVIYLTNKSDVLINILNCLTRSLRYQNLYQCINCTLYRKLVYCNNNESLDGFLYKIILNGLQWFYIYDLIFSFRFTNLFNSSQIHIIIINILHFKILLIQKVMQLNILNHIKLFFHAIGFSKISNKSNYTIHKILATH